MALPWLLIRYGTSGNAPPPPPAPDNIDTHDGDYSSRRERRGDEYRRKKRERELEEELELARAMGLAPLEVVEKQLEPAEPAEIFEAKPDYTETLAKIEALKVAAKQVETIQAAQQAIAKRQRDEERVLMMIANDEAAMLEMIRNAIKDDLQ